jgi:hypothetical protein
VDGDAGGGRGRWGTAVALFAAVAVLSALDTVPLVTLPLALVLLAAPVAPRWRWVAMAVFLALFGLSFPGTALGWLSRGWALLLGGGFLVATLRRPRWGVLPRAMAALGSALAAGLGLVAATAGWSRLDARVREHLVAVSEAAVERLGSRGEEAPWMAQLAESAREYALLQWELFPALVALQSLAALALVSWLVARLRRGEGGPFALRPLREFRFNDQLVWVAIAGLLLLVLPLSAFATRLGWNALLFMGGLYALRGLGIFVFLAGGAPSLAGMVFGALALLFVYPLVLTGAVLVGLVDTWLDLRARASASATPPS